jgi:hypothetical protein
MGKSTVAYYAKAFITAIKNLIVHTPEASTIKLFDYIKIFLRRGVSSTIDLLALTSKGQLLLLQQIYVFFYKAIPNEEGKCKEPSLQ